MECKYTHYFQLMDVLTHIHSWAGNSGSHMYLWIYCSQIVCSCSPAWQKDTLTDSLMCKCRTAKKFQFQKCCYSVKDWHFLLLNFLCHFLWFQFSSRPMEPMVHPYTTQILLCGSQLIRGEVSLDRAHGGLLVQIAWGNLTTDPGQPSQLTGSPTRSPLSACAGPASSQHVSLESSEDGGRGPRNDWSEGEQHWEDRPRWRWSGRVQ